MADRETIIERIKKLLALSNNKGATEAEAIEAALQAQKLVAKHGISDWELEDEVVVEEIVSISCDVNDRQAIHRQLAANVASNFRCRCFVKGNNINFYGYETDANAAQMTYLYLRKAMVKHANAEVKKARAEYGYADGVYNSSCSGFIAGVRDVLEKQSQSLMIVVPKEVNDSYDAFAKNFGTARSPQFGRFSAPSCRDAYGRCRTAAHDTINGHRVASGGKMSLPA